MTATVWDIYRFRSPLLNANISSNCTQVDNPLAHLHLDGIEARFETGGMGSQLPRRGGWGRRIAISRPLAVLIVCSLPTRRN